MLSFSKGTVNVTGNVTASDAKFTPVWLCSTVANNSTVTVGTVGAGKKWTIIGVQLSSNMGATAAIRKASLDLNGVSILVNTHEGGAAGDVSHTANPISMNFTYGTGPVLIAGQTVTVVSSGGSCNAQGTVVYIEESA